MQQATWQAPGPGTWERDRAHFDRTVSRVMTDVMEIAAPRGMREGLDLTGAPLDTIEIRFVNGQMYRRLVPVIGGSGRGPRTPPPAWVIRSVFALHPRLRRRTRTAAAALEAKSWRDEADRWDSVWKPELIAVNRRLARFGLDDAPTEALADHLAETLEHVERGMTLHFRLHVSDLGPIALLLDHTNGWGLEPAGVMAALAGASPATSAPRDALKPLARELAALGVVPESLADVRRAGERAAELLDDYLLEFGSRLTTGYDVTDLTLAELPEVILSSLSDERLLGDRTAADEALERGDAALAVLRTGVPDNDVELFDRLVVDARRVYGLRDENGPITAEWPCGILRAGLLEAGSRLVAVGRLHAVDHVFDLSAIELLGSLRGEPGPRSDAVATRNRTRLGWAGTESPPYLGPPPSEPDLDALPEAMRQMMRMTLNVVSMLEAEPDHGKRRGTGIGSVPYRGTARVVADADEALERCEPGDVVITRFTAPTFNSVLALAGAVVTEHGGLLCHTAVIARELGIAAVVGVSGALDIVDGTEVDVDPVAGTVTVVG